MMDKKAQEPIPCIPFDLCELQGIERIVWAYLQYLRRLPLSARNGERQRSVSQLQRRLAACLLTGQSKDMQILLSRQELQHLLDALREFARLVQRFFPQNEERAAVLETVNMWRQRLACMIAEFET